MSKTLAMLRRLLDLIDREMAIGTAVGGGWAWLVCHKGRECHGTARTYAKAKASAEKALDELRAAHAVPIFVASSDRKRWEVMARDADGMPVQFRRRLGFRVAYIDRHADANQRYCWHVWAIDKDVQSGWTWQFDSAALEANKVLEAK